MTVARRLRHAGFLAAKGLYQAAGPAGQGRLVLVPGVQRSGTNLAMNLLERSWQTAVFHEHDRRAFEGYVMRPVAEIQALKARSRAQVFVLKALLESHRTTLLMEQLAGPAGPEAARALWLVRDYRDMVNSHLVSWPGFGEHLDKLVADPGSAGFRGLGMSAETREILAAHYRADDGVASHVALFWWLRNRLFFDQALERDARVLVLGYEALVSRPAETTKRLCAHLGLTYSARLHAMIHARSVAKRRAPEISAPVAALCQAMLDRFQGSGIRHQGSNNKVLG